MQGPSLKPSEIPVCPSGYSPNSLTCYTRLCASCAGPLLLSHQDDLFIPGITFQIKVKINYSIFISFPATHCSLASGLLYMLFPLLRILFPFFFSFFFICVCMFSLLLFFTHSYLRLQPEHHFPWEAPWPSHHPPTPQKKDYMPLLCSSVANYAELDCEHLFICLPNQP